jgi:hypothetical protein
MVKPSGVEVTEPIVSAPVSRKLMSALVLAAIVPTALVVLAFRLNGPGAPTGKFNSSRPAAEMVPVAAWVAIGVFAPSAVFVELTSSAAVALAETVAPAPTVTTPSLSVSPKPATRSTSRACDCTVPLMTTSSPASNTTSPPVEVTVTPPLTVMLSTWVPLLSAVVVVSVPPLEKLTA